MLVKNVAIVIVCENIWKNTNSDLRGCVTEARLGTTSEAQLPCTSELQSDNRPEVEPDQRLGEHVPLPASEEQCRNNQKLEASKSSLFPSSINTNPASVISTKALSTLLSDMLPWLEALKTPPRLSNLWQLVSCQEYETYRLSSQWKKSLIFDY